MKRIIENTQIRAWLEGELGEETRKERNITEADLDEIERLLIHLNDWYYDPVHESLGHFLTYVLKNNFVNASCQADKTNVKALDVYARFVYNRLPPDWNSKALVYL